MIIDGAVDGSIISEFSVGPPSFPVLPECGTFPVYADFAQDVRESLLDALAGSVDGTTCHVLYALLRSSFRKLNVPGEGWASQKTSTYVELAQFSK